MALFCPLGKHLPVGFEKINRSALSLLFQPSLHLPPSVLPTCSFFGLQLKFNVFQILSLWTFPCWPCTSCFFLWASFITVSSKYYPPFSALIQTGWFVCLYWDRVSLYRPGGPEILSHLPASASRVKGRWPPHTGWFIIASWLSFFPLTRCLWEKLYTQPLYACVLSNDTAEPRRCWWQNITTPWV